MADPDEGIEPHLLIQAVVRSDMIRLAGIAERDGERIWADLFYDLANRILIRPQTEEEKNEKRGRQ